VDDWLCEGKEERRGRSKDDLRARSDFFNIRIWLDESASEWGKKFPTRTVAGVESRVQGLSVP